MVTAAIPTTVKTPKTRRKSTRGMGSTESAKALKKALPALKSAAETIAFIPTSKKPVQPVGKIRIGERINGTALVRRYQGGRPVAPVYLEVDTLSFQDRLQRAFDDADMAGIDSVLVDGVLYPKGRDGWHIWRSSDELLDYVLREKKLPEGEIRFRFALRQLERARHDLDFVFHLHPPQTEHWQESLKFQQQMLADARKGVDKAHIAKLERQVKALETAIAAQVAVAERTRYNEQNKESIWQNEAICTTK